MVIHSHLPSSGPPERPPVSLRGIRTSLLLVFVSTFAFFAFFLMSLRQERVNNPALLPTGVVFLSGGFLLLPLAISFLLLSSRKVNGIAAGAGAACGFYGAVLFAAPYALGVMGFFIAMSGWGTGHPDRNLTAAGLALLTFLIGSVAVVWSGVRIGKTHWGAFGTSVGASVLYVLFGMSFLGSASYAIGRHAQREVEQANRKKTVIDGPFTESKELVAGYWLIQVKSLEEAIEWAKRSPVLPDQETEIEVREFIEFE